MKALPPIVVVPYDPDWPARFEAERAVLEDVLSPWLEGGIHHIGSTAVAGLAAKPIIDMMAGVRDLEAARAAGKPLAGIGYVHEPHRPGDRAPLREARCGRADDAWAPPDGAGKRSVAGAARLQGRASHRPAPGRRIRGAQARPGTRLRRRLHGIEAAVRRRGSRTVRASARP